MSDIRGIIILDGPDACGKTTLQDYLVKTFNAYPIHLTYPAPDNLSMWEYQTREMMHAIKMSEQRLVIVDRHWVSEMIYAKVFRGGSPWPHMGRMMQRVWMKHSAVNVLCLPYKIKDAVKRHKENLDPKHPYPDDKYVELLTEYLDFAVSQYMNPFFLQYRIEQDGKNMDYYSERVIDLMLFLQSQQYGPAALVKEKDLAGHLLKAKVLVVGQQLKPKSFHVKYGCMYPFYEYGNSSLFLTEHLDKLNVNEVDVMWTNAIQLSFLISPHVKPLYDFGVRNIITLGKEAETVVASLSLPFTMLPHPQYAKRFKYKDYDKLLEEAFRVAIKS